VLAKTETKTETKTIKGPGQPDVRRWATLVLAVFAVGLLLRLPTFFRPLLSDDEAIYATTADALLRKGLLYRDVVDHKPPLIYHVYQAGFGALGAYNTHGAHVLVVLSVLLTAGFLLAARQQEGDEGDGAGLATAALFLIFSTTWHDYDALAANCELFVLAPQAMAALLLVRGFGRPTSKLNEIVIHFAVGALIGLSALFKYQGLTFLGVSVGMLAWAAFLGRILWPRAAALAVLQTIGAMSPAAVYLGWCAIAGNAEATVYWFRFNFSYVGAGLTGLAAIARGLRRTAMVGGAALVPYALGVAGAVAVAVRLAQAIRSRVRGTPDGEPPSPASVLALLWLVTSAVAVSAGGRFFGHYFHLILAPLCLLAGPGLLRMWSKGRAFRVVLAFLCTVPPLIFFALASFARPVAALDEPEPPYNDVAARIAALTSPDERVFVWGNSPQLYVLARRPMGARFSFCNYMTGESPGTPTETGQWNADSNQLPAAWEMLFADLEARRPSLFVDAAAAGWDGYDKFPVTRYPRLQAYLDRHYRPVETRRGVVLYRRLP
jgi:hypothetical protein